MALCSVRLDRAVGDADLARLAVQLEEDRARAVLARPRRSSGTGRSASCPARSRRRSRRPPAGRRRTPASGSTLVLPYCSRCFSIVEEHLRVQQVRQHVVVARLAARSSSASSLRAAAKSTVGSVAPGPALRSAWRRAESRMIFWSTFGQPPSGSPSSPCIISTTLRGKFSGRVGFSTSIGGQAVGDHEQRQVADDLARRRHLHDVAEQLVDRRRTPRRSPCQRSSRPRLFACWRRFVYCPPGISCWYTSARRRLQPFLERVVELADGRPVVG